jgi:DNA repair exonuclease SbcCD ATPase subunit
MKLRPMRQKVRWQWWHASRELMVLVVAGAVAGCGGLGRQAPEVADSRVARLPAEDRQALLEEQRDLDRITANIDTMQVAVDEAEQYRSMVESEHRASQQSLEASQEAVDLAESAGDRMPSDDAAERARLAEVRANLAEEKMNYAEALVALRQAQAQELEAERAHAEARLQRSRFERLQAHDLHGDLEGEEFTEAEQQARQEWEQARQRTSALEARVQALAERWQQLEQQVQADDPSASSPIEPPEPPRLLEPQDTE